MRNARALAFVLLIISSCKTGHGIHSSDLSLHQRGDSMVRDRDDKTYPIQVLLDGNLWMTANLDLQLPHSFCYDNKKENCQQYGRLYTWEAANQGCKLLGEGWSLPSDDEWLRLIDSYGNGAADSTAMRQEAYQALLYPGASGFNALLGGGRAPFPDTAYARAGAHGFYWTSTEIDTNAAVFYNFAAGAHALYRQNEGEKSRAFSVRCVKTSHGHK